ncbi:MAG: acetyltransferase [bacterium]|nr:acetyltransferase [bacterium]
MSERILVLGAGGHAKVVVSTLQDAGRKPHKVLDDDSAKWAKQVLNTPIGGPITDLAKESPDCVITAFGDNRLRAEKAGSMTVNWTTAVHPTAYVHPSAVLGPGTLVCAGAIVQPGARIGAHAIINTGASIDHDCELGDFVHLAPGARLAGNVRVGPGTLIGIGSVVVPGVVIGEWARLGAGAAVTGDLPSNCIAVGVPARLLEVVG